MLRAYYVDAIRTDKLKREQDRIRRELLDMIHDQDDAAVGAGLCAPFVGER